MGVFKGSKTHKRLKERFLIRRNRTKLFVFKGFFTTPFTECRWCPGTVLLKEDSPVLYIVDAQAPILLKRDYPVLYIADAQAPILLKRDFLVLYIMGAQAPYFWRKKFIFVFRYSI